MLAAPLLGRLRDRRPSLAASHLDELITAMAGDNMSEEVRLLPY